MTSRISQGVAILALLLTLLLTGAVDSAAAPVPSFKHLPDHLKPNHCDPFSKAAVLMLHKQGVPAVRIIYGWHTPNGSGYHAALVFKHEGALYAMDNEHREPIKLSKGAKTDWSAANALGGASFYTHTWMTNEANQRVKPRKLSDLFAPNPAWLEQFNIANQ